MNALNMNKDNLLNLNSITPFNILNADFRFLILFFTYTTSLLYAPLNIFSYFSFGIPRITIVIM